MITPHETYRNLAESIGVKELYFKREDLHPYKSHKGRSIPLMIDNYYAQGERKFAISSSGNAALAAALHAKKINADNSDKVELDIFVGINVNQNKLQKLKELGDDRIRVMIKERPLQAMTTAIQEGTRSLRQSTDDISLVGYASLAKEIAEIKNAGAVFVGTSSGTTAQALAAYFIEKNIPIQVHIVQTSSCHPISDAFETYDGPNEKSIADAITDITAIRKQKLEKLIRKTGGNGWFATNYDIETAQKLVKEKVQLEISTNSALSIVGAMHAVYRGWETNGAIICLICGE